MMRSMMAGTRLGLLASVGLVAAGLAAPAQAQQASELTFFVTSAGPGKGADLGGIAGADAHCGKLAQAAGSAGKTWHAYLSTQARPGQPAINARDRIGAGNTSWNSAHPTRGCSQEALVSTGGVGLFYCFAIN